jgi:SP family galactose:H+ symporter-like MFS transporter
MNNAQWFSFKVAIVGSIGGLLFGYDLGVISMALPLITTEFNLTSVQTEMVAGFLMVGCTLGALVGGSIADCIGRKRTVYLTCWVFIIGSIMLSCATSVNLLLCGRVIVGIGVAISAIVDVAYLTEVSPNRYRGAIVSTNELMITVGLLGAYAIDYGVTTTTPESSSVAGWRYMFMIPAFLSVIWMILMARMPESPKWLIIKGKKQEALFLFQQRAATHEEAAMELDYAVTVNALRIVNLEEESSIWHWRKCLLVAVFLMVAQNFSGHTCVLTYSVNFFRSAGVVKSSQLAMGATILLGIIKVIFTAISMCLVDRVAGRRWLLLCGVLGMIGGLCTLVIFVPTSSVGTHATGTTGSSSEAGQHVMSIVPAVTCVVATCVVVASYAIGFGPMTYLITSELFPDQLRGRAIGKPEQYYAYFAVVNRSSSCRVFNGC